MIKYILMHKNDKCGTILFDENIGRITEYHDDRNGLSPYLGNCDIKKIQKWWEMRAVPASSGFPSEAARDARRDVLNIRSPSPTPPVLISHISVLSLSAKVIIIALYQCNYKFFLKKGEDHGRI